MRKTLFIFAGAILCVALSVAQDAAPRHFDGDSWWNYVKVLADDKMEGRDTGSEGEKRAQAYIVEQLRADGLEPAGEKGFYQPVKFVQRQIVEKDSSLALVRDGKTQAVTLGDDAILSARINPAPSVNAPLVFVGYGLKIPEAKIDDFAGLDLKGKIAVYFTGSPAEVSARSPLTRSRFSNAGRACTRRARSASSRYRIPRSWMFPGHASH